MYGYTANNPPTGRLHVSYSLVRLPQADARPTFLYTPQRVFEGVLMDSHKVNDWLQVIGLFGVLGGLIFVGVQLRLDRQVALRSGVEEATTAVMYWAELVAAYPEAWRKGASGDRLTPDETVQFEALAEALAIHRYSAWNRNTQVGVQPPERFIGEAALDFYTNPGLLAWWQRHQERLESVGAGGSLFDTAVDEEIRRLAQQNSPD